MTNLANGEQESGETLRILLPGCHVMHWTTFAIMSLLVSEEMP